MPDWTYLPLRRASEVVVGPHRARTGALRLLATLARTAAGRSIIRSFDLTSDLPAAQITANGVPLPSPCGVVLSDPSKATVDALRAVGLGWVATPTTIPAGAVKPDSTEFSTLVSLARAGIPVIMNEAMVEHGPTTAQRINEVLESDKHTDDVSRAGSWWNPLTWYAWTWAMWLGIAMVCGGIGAAVITYGPVLLGYDRAFLGTDTEGLTLINARLVPFLQHDRITMAGCMAAIGFMYLGQAVAMRQGWPWARAAFALSGAVGFPTFFLFLGYGFFDPLHASVAIGFFPLWLCGVAGRRIAPTWIAPDRVDESARRRAAVGQLIMVLVAIGVTVSGVVIMLIGLRGVLIPADRAFMATDQSTMDAALQGRLLRFVAHDRAGFGGALTSLGVGVLGSSLWGWRNGVRSTMYSIGAASLVGLGAAIAVHWQVGYTDSVHLLPAYLAVPLVGVALLLSREWFASSRPRGLDGGRRPDAERRIGTVSAADRGNGVDPQ